MAFLKKLIVLSLLALQSTSVLVLDPAPPLDVSIKYSETDNLGSPYMQLGYAITAKIKIKNISSGPVTITEISGKVVFERRPRPVAVYTVPRVLQPDAEFTFDYPFTPNINREEMTDSSSYFYLHLLVGLEVDGKETQPHKIPTQAILLYEK